MLPELLAQIAADQPIASVSAEGAYDTGACHALHAELQIRAAIRSRFTTRGTPITQRVG